MPSSFRRLDLSMGGLGAARPPSSTGAPPPAGPVQPRAPGTKSWINGQTLISSGNKDLDSVLGGGLCLGTLTLVEEDRFSDHALVLSKYFVAQGVSCKQRCLVVGAEDPAALREALVTHLPYDLTHKKNQSTAAHETTPSTGTAEAKPATAPPSPSPFSTTALQQALPPGGDSLSIAWQYRKYMGGGGAGASSTSSSSSSSFCHSYDLSRTMQPEVLAAAAAAPVVLGIPEDDPEPFVRVHEAVAEALHALPPHTTLRVLVKSFLSKTGAWPTDQFQQALRVLHSLRQLAWGKPVAILVTIPAHHLPSPQHRRLLARVADTVLELQSFASQRYRTAGEFAPFAGLLYVRALQHVNALAPVRGPSNKLGVKRNRRKLHIEPLHLPPEGVRTLTEDVEKSSGKKKGDGGSGKKLKVPGVLCATSGSAARGGSLDF